jgi:hypothetical protein
VAENSLPLKEASQSEQETFPDKSLKAVKFIFLFIPGVILLDMIGPILFLSILYGEIFDPLVSSLGAALVGTFLSMMGIGKLSDLNYLKVPVMVALFSMVIGFLFLPIVFYFGYDLGFIKFTVPIALALGYLTKRNIDRSDRSTEN